MPIKIPRKLPAHEILTKENIFIMDEDRALSQDIRPLNIIILNLMPEKEKTETQLLRLLGNTPLQVNVNFLRMASHESKNTSRNHLDQFYKTFSEIKDRKFDGMIITGAPIEHLKFEEVNYWNELVTIMEWSKTNITSCLHICWGAQAALYYHYGINKYPLPEKCSGIFTHRVNNKYEKLLRGFDDVFLAPHSRYTNVAIEDIKAVEQLRLLAVSDEVGPLIIGTDDGKHFMITGHLEYSATTLAEEYERDIAKGIEIKIPKNYFPNNDPTKTPLNSWRSHAHLLFSNWLNYYVYQETPYEWS